MSNISQNELNSIRDMVVGHQVIASKLSNYANQCQDAELKALFKNASTSSSKSAQTLLEML